MANPTAEEAILTKLAQAPSFHPAGAKLFVPDWTLDPGDVVTVTAKDNVNDPDETPTSYNVPIYSMNLTWNGASRVEIESTGNQQREPLSALRRKEYQTGRRGYGATKALEEEVDEQYQHWTTENNVYRESVYKIMGVELNEDGTVKYIQATDEQGNPIYDEQGNPVWELDEAGNPKPVYNPDSDGSISGKVRTTAQDLESLYTVTGVASLPSGETTLYSYTSKIKQTADSVSSEVTAARGGETSLSSKISQLSGQIGLVIEKKDGNDVVSRSAIIAAINEDSTSTATISADQIDLQGYVTADELYVDGALSAGKTIYAGNLHVYEDAEIVGNISTSADSELTLGIVEATSLSATDTLYIGDTEITEELLNSFLTSGIVSASVANNILTLTDSSGNTVNFSKATSVSGEWGSNQQGQPTGVFTVTATQTNRNTTTGQDETTTVGTVLTSITQAGHWGNTSNQEDPNTYYQSTNATINTSQQLHTVKTAEINAAGRFYAGKNSVGLAPMSYTEFQGENYPASQTIYTDTTGRTDASGATDNLHRDITLSLDADDEYVYMKHGSDIIARISNSGGSAGYSEGYADGQSNADAIIDTISHPAGDILYQASKLNIDIYANPYLNLTDQYGILHPISKTGVTETIQIPVVVTNSVLDKGNISKTNDYTGSYTITGGGGNVNLDGSIGTNIPVGVTDLSLSLALGTPNTDLGTTGTARWSDENHNYVYSVNSSLTVDGTGNVLTRTVSGLILNPEKAIEYGQSTVSAILTGATAPSGTTPQTLATGTYGLYLTKNNTQDSDPIVYYRVTTGGTVNYVVSSNGATVMAWNGLNLVGSIYPNTDVTLGSTDQFGRRQISYNGKSGYVSTSNISTVKGATNYPGRIGWVGDESDPDARTVYSLAKVVLAATDTGESTHSVQVEYTDGTIVPNGAEVTVDASAISGGGPSYNIQHNRAITYSANGNFTLNPSSGYDAMSQVAVTVDVPSGTTTQRTATGLDDTIVLPSSHTGTATITGNVVLYDDDSESSNFPVRIDAHNVFEAGRAAGADLELNRTVTYTTNGTKALNPSSGYDGMKKATITINVPQSSASLGSRSFSSNGTYSANDFGYDGFSSVTVNVSTSHNITAGTPVARTGSTGSRVYMGSIAASRLAANMWISVPISCGGTSKTFYISIT